MAVGGLIGYGIGQMYDQGKSPWQWLVQFSSIENFLNFIYLAKY